MKIFYFKKATEVMANWLFWICFTIAVGAVALILVHISGVNVAEAAKIQPKVEDELVLIPRFYNSEHCFAYKGEIGKVIGVHTRVIGPSKFTQTNLDNKCFLISNVKYAFSLSLEVLNFDDPPSVILNLGPINTFNWIEGGFAPKKITEDVFVLYNDVKYEGKLIIEIKNV